MKSRPVAAMFFVALCLLLCGLILHRQIAAHPLPPAADQDIAGDQHFDGRRAALWMGLRNGHHADPALTGQAQQVVQGQLTALRDGDGLKAMSYQSRAMRRRFGSPGQFQQQMADDYPEFAHCRKAHYWPVWTDKTEQHVWAVVIVEGENGRHARGEYLLVPEDGHWKINGVAAQRLPG